MKKNELLNKVRNDPFWRTLSDNTFWAFVGDSGAAIINLVVVAVLVRALGNGDYGFLVLAQSYSLIVDTILNVQSWKGVIQYGQKALVKKKIQDFYGYIKNGCILDIVTAIIGGIVGILLAGAVGKMFGWSDEVILCAQIFSATIFSHFAGVPTAVLRIMNKFNLVALQKNISVVIKLVALGLVLCLNGHLDLIQATIIYCIADVVGNLLLVIFAVVAFRKKYSIKAMVRAHSPKDNKEFVRYTLWGTVAEAVDVPIKYFDVFIASILGTDMVAVYKVFQQLASAMGKVATPVYQAVMPQFSELSAKGLKQRGYDVVKKIRNAMMLIFGVGSLVAGLTSPWWLNWIYGDLYAENWYVLLVFLLAQSVLLSYSPIHPYFLSLGKAKQTALCVLVANIIYIFLAIGLVRVGGMLALVMCGFVQGVIVIVWKRAVIKKELSNEEVKKYELKG